MKKRLKTHGYIKEIQAIPIIPLLWIAMNTPPGGIQPFYAEKDLLNVVSKDLGDKHGE
ncbi:MAG: hypothetical protein ACTSRA_07655 [Promethearchaeota archaeon]